MGKIIKNLFSEIKPTVQEWGEKKHVPINVREGFREDEEGKKVKTYTYDVVERVEQPITVDNIVSAAIEGEFTSDDLKYITTHFTKTTDERVVRYKNFVEEVTKNAEKSGYPA